MHTAVLWWTLSTAWAGVVDADGDGFSDQDDCDESSETIYPGAPEIPGDGIDQDCDGVDTCYIDEDGDGFGASPVMGPLPVVLDDDLDCGNDSSATSDIPFDCDDTDVTVHAGATEVVADDIDQDCDGLDRCHVDADGDGFGIEHTRASASCADAGVAAMDGDCDDADGDIHPDAFEACDGIDNNCDDLYDEEPSPDATLYFYDGDGDGYGVASNTAQACGPHLDYVALDGDCDDANPTVSPDGIEVCDDLDNDCDGEVDGPGVGDERWYADGDGDGFGDPEVFIDGCRPVEGNWVPRGQAFDCADKNAKSGPCSACGCASGGSSWWLWAALLLGIRTSGRGPAPSGPPRRSQGSRTPR